MRNIKFKLLVTAVVAGISTTAIAASPNDASGAPSVNIPVMQLKYFDTGIHNKNGIGTLQAAPAYGDLNKGPHGTFVKMPAGFVSEIHIHTGEYWGVVITGVGVNGIPGSKDVPLPVGSYWSQKGGERHITKCISSNECIFFISQSVKFDDIPDGMKK